VSTFGHDAEVPAHATAMGKALLAFSPPEVVDAFISRGLEGYTPFTITAPDRFRRALATTRFSRLAVSRWELEPNRSAFAVPVFGCGGRIAAAIELRVNEPVAELNAVRPALVIAGRSLTRELSNGAAVPSAGPRRHRSPAAAPVARRIRPLDDTARKEANDE
jgi:DNA-binding IclR family transcriptional regulator